MPWNHLRSLQKDDCCTNISLSQLLKHSDKINDAHYLIEVTQSSFMALMLLFKIFYLALFLPFWGWKKTLPFRI